MIKRARYVDGVFEGFDVTYVGCVLYVGERNYHNDSDFYALVWDEDKQEIIDIEYATTRFPTYANAAIVDAIEEVKEEAAKWLADKYYCELVVSERHRVQIIGIDTLVVIYKGRKVPIGTDGIVIWKRHTRYGDCIRFVTTSGEEYFSNIANAIPAFCSLPNYKGLRRRADAVTIEAWDANRWRVVNDYFC